jgi:hypothetical protein
MAAGTGCHLVLPRPKANIMIPGPANAQPDGVTFKLIGGKHMTAGTKREGYSPRVAAAGLGAGAAAAGLLLAATMSPASAIVLGSLALACWCAALLCVTAATASWRGTGLGQWKLGAWLLAWVAVTSGLATMAFSPQQGAYAAELTPGAVGRGLWITAAAMTAWAAGYCAGPRRLPGAGAARCLAALRRLSSERVSSPLTPWLLYAAGTAARLLTAALTGYLGYLGDASAAVSSAPVWQQVLSLAGQACPMAVAVSAVRAWRQLEPGAGTATLILFLAEITYGAVSGNKQVFVVAVLALAIPRAAVRERIPRGILLVGVAVFLLIVIPFTAAYRTAARGGPVTLTTAQAASAAPAIARQALSSASPGVIGPSVAYLAQRVQEIDGAAIVAQRSPAQIPYAPAAQVVTGPLAALIPRALWPGKPVDTAGYQFNQEYYGAPAGDYTSALITPWADLYRHGGWPPLAAGMLFLGCLFRVLDDTLDITDPRAMLLVLILVPDLVKAEADWTDTLAAIPGLILVWLVVCAVAFRRVPSLTRDHPG